MTYEVTNEVTIAQAVARQKRAEAALKRRNDERLCAWDFLTWGDTRGDHADFCIFVIDGQPPCSRDYHPGAPPDDETLYEGTGVGALFGLKGTERHLWQLAGWNVAHLTADITNPKGIA